MLESFLMITCLGACGFCDQYMEYDEECGLCPLHPEHCSQEYSCSTFWMFRDSIEIGNLKNALKMAELMRDTIKSFEYLVSEGHTDAKHLVTDSENRVSHKAEERQPKK